MIKIKFCIFVYMSGLLLTSDNIYGLINPPTDPSDNLPEAHQDISSAAVRWDYFVDLSDNIGKRLVAGSNITIVGNTISSTGGSGSSSSGSQKITDLSLVSLSLLQATFTANLLNKTYDKNNFTLKENNVVKPINEVIVDSGKLSILLDVSLNQAQKYIYNNLTNNGQYYYESFNDQVHDGSHNNLGTYVQGIGDLLYGKYGDGTTSVFRLDVQSDLLTNTTAKGISFWMKDFGCIPGRFLFSSGSISMMSLFSMQLFVDTGDTNISLFGQNVSKIYFDGNLLTLGDVSGNLNRSVSPAINASSCSGWHHWYIEAESKFRTIEILSFEGQRFGTGTVDDIRLFSQALDISSIEVLAIQPLYHGLSSLSNVTLMYVPGSNVDKNLTTSIDDVQSFLWSSSKIYLQNNSVESAYLTDVSVNEKDNILEQQIQDLSSEIHATIDSLATGKFMNNRQQVLYELLTQQPAVFTASGEVINSAGQITVNWHYDDVMAETFTDVLAKLAFQQEEKKRLLPFIDTLTVELSGNITTGNNSFDNLSNTWITYNTGIWPKTFSNNETYNSAQYKTITFSKTPPSNINNNSILNILGKTEPFDMRIYGTNYSEDYPTINNRALYFRDLSYVLANVPSIAQIISQNAINSSSSITFVCKVDETELNVSDSVAVLIDASNSYYPFETTSSITNGISIPNPIVYSNTNVSLSNIAKNTNFNITLSSLRNGTKYKFSTQFRNDLTGTSSYSQISSEFSSDFTRLPTSTATISFTNMHFNTSNHVYRISTPDGSWPANLNNSSVNWLNKADNSSFNISNTTKTFEISKPYSNNQQTETVGYGKFIDNSENLIRIQVDVSGIKRQELIYGGFNVTPTRTNFNGNTFNFFDNPTASDPYNGNNSSQGFRLNGTMKINDIPYNYIGDPSNVAYKVKYSYNKLSDVGGGAEINNGATGNDVYIDDLTGNSSITKTETGVYIKNVLKCMGIPSVRQFDISFARTYSNIHSEYKYCRYHSSSPAGITVGLLYSVSKTNISSNSYNGKININRNEINGTGTYTFGDSEISNRTSSRFKNLHFTQNIGFPTSGDSSPNDSINIVEQSFNLNGDTQSNTNITLQYYCDYNSFNKSGSRINSNKLDITNLAEINNITKFETNLNDISCTMITSHEDIIEDWTLLYIGGGFKTNARQRYPTVSSYSWIHEPSSPTITNTTYDSGTKSYDLNGNLTGGDTGYKWIVFKFDMSNDTTIHNNGGIENSYLNVYQKLIDYGFSSNILSKLKDYTDLEVIGFISQKYGSNVKIGNLGRNFSQLSIWTQNVNNINLYDLHHHSDSYKYGSIYNESSTKWGPILSTFNGDNDIFIYLGLKNNVSL